ncbi:MAG: hypothetical protein AAFZ18_35270, partial [Myxococcota bacterium]
RDLRGLPLALDPTHEVGHSLHRRTSFTTETIWAYHVGHARLENPFGFSALDTKALAMGALGLSWSETTLKTVARMVRASHPDPSQLHHAGEDARHTARVFCALMNGREAGTL